MTLPPHTKPPHHHSRYTTRTTGDPMDGEHMSKYRDYNTHVFPLIWGPTPGNVGQGKGGEGRKGRGRGKEGGDRGGPGVAEPLPRSSPPQEG